MKRPPRDPEKEVREQATLLKAWKVFHAAELEQALTSAHGAIIAQLMVQLDRLELDSAAALLDFMQRADWRSVDYATRRTALHQINESITRLRERSGMAGIDDPIPPKLNAFFVIKQMLFPHSPASNCPAPALSGQTSVLGCDVTAAAQTE